MKRHALRLALACAAVALAPAARAELRIDAPIAAGLPEDLVVTGRVYGPGASRLVPHSDEKPAPAENVGAFLTHEADDAPVVVAVQGRTAETRTDDEGFFEVRFTGPPALAAGRGEARVTATVKGEAVTARVPVLVAPPGPGLTVVTDFDDTLVHTGVGSKAELLENVFLRRAEDLEPVPGMARFLRCLEAGTADRPPERTVVHYLSASPVNLFRKIRRFLALRGFPPGPLGLRRLDTGLTARPAYKRDRILALAQRFPGHRLVLVGDAGERDPEIYAEVRRRLGDRVAGIYIHRVAGADDAPGRFEGMVLFDDGRQALEAAAQRGLVLPVCAELAPAPPARE